MHILSTLSIFKHAAKNSNYDSILSNENIKNPSENSTDYQNLFKITY